MQSWGASSRFKKLTTEREPTKSGVIGLVAAALGRERNADIGDLSSLKFGVRIDQQGVLLRDYHTAHNPRNTKLAFISDRYYLCDAVFVVGLESDDESLLDEIKKALESPRFPLYLGRRSCPPTGPIVLGISQVSITEAFKMQDWQAQNWYMRKRSHEQNIDLEIVVDAPFNTPHAFVKRDLPISFNDEFRRYRFRSTTSDLQGVSVLNPEWSEPVDELFEGDAGGKATEHDPFLALEVSDVSFESRN